MVGQCEMCLMPPNSIHKNGKLHIGYRLCGTKLCICYYSFLKSCKWLPLENENQDGEE